MSSAIKSRHGLKEYLLLMSALPQPDASEQGKLLAKWLGGDEAALRQLTEAYLPKVLMWVSPRRGEGFSFQELIALGNCALIESLRAWRGGPERLEERLCQSVHDALDSAFKMNA